MPSMMRRLAWCGTNAAEVRRVDPGPLAGLQRERRDRGGGPAEDRLALLLDVRAASPRCVIASLLSGAEPQTTGPMPAGSPSAVARDDRGAGAVARR